jgi:hypothetical protein
LNLSIDSWNGILYETEDNVAIPSTDKLALILYKNQIMAYYNIHGKDGFGGLVDLSSFQCGDESETTTN